MTSADAERRAWQILIAAFSAFVLLCGATVYALQWFFFQSTVSLDATLYVARGTVKVTVPNTLEPLAVSGQRTDLETGTTIQTDATSQAVVVFFDPGTNQPLGSLVIFRDSQIEITAMSAPRFGFNPAPYHIQVTGKPPGRGQLLIFASQEHPIDIEMITAQSISSMSKPGLYSFDVTDQRTHVTVSEGEAVVSARTDNQPVKLKSGNRVSVDETGETVTVLADETSLITNNDFSRPYSVGWKAYNQGDPAGSVYNSRVDGRDAVVIDRSQERWPNLILNHGETGLVQTLDSDVSQFNSLEMRVTLYVDEQNLSTCGVVGSECPLMFRLEYVDPGGVDRVYIHGFYAYDDRNLNYPFLCDTCRAEHDRINLRNWYTYSENLITLLPSEQRPIQIKQLSLYASGHAYKVYISEADLLGVKQPPTR